MVFTNGICMRLPGDDVAFATRIGAAAVATGRRVYTHGHDPVEMP